MDYEDEDDYLSGHHVPKGNYEALELRPYTGRVGAMDAYALPSMVDGKTRAPRKPLLLSSSAQTGPAAMRGRL